MTEDALTREVRIYREAMDVFMKTLAVKLGEDGIEGLIDTHHEHVTLLLVGDESAVQFRVRIDIGKKVPQSELRREIDECRATPGRAVDFEIP